MPPKLRNQDSESLTIASIRTLWEKEFLPSIREEIKAEIDGMKREITSLTVKCNDIENSQTFLSSEYDSLKGLVSHQEFVGSNSCWRPFFGTNRLDDLESFYNPSYI